MAPDFTLPDADGKPVHLADYRGQNVVVYFYPAASTPGCTKQACDFRDNLAELNDAGFAVLGISPDKPAKLAKFRDKEELTFPLLSDPDRAVLGGLRRVRREDALRQDGHRRDPLDVRRRSQGQDRAGAVQREGHRARGETAARSGSLIASTCAARRGRSPTAEANGLGPFQ